MSNQYPGGFISKTPPTPDGPYQDSSAYGIWTMSQAAEFQKEGLWPIPGNSSSLYAFTTFTFTNAGQTARVGPSLSQCQSAYSATAWTQNTAYFNMTTNGIQLWTVPKTGSYTIDAYGAQGGSSNTTGSGGAGARSLGTFSLTRGDVIAIAVGQRGTVTTSATGGSSYTAGGGGGSFVYNTTTSTLLAVAGGGGGAAGPSGVNGLPALAGTHGGRGGDNSTSDADNPGVGSAGGASGAGGKSESISNGSGGGGGGWLTDGEDDPSLRTTGGRSYPNGLVGGQLTYYNTPEMNGGFGGGGGGGNYGGGGGGGYSGGGAGWANDYGGGGGGSYNSGSSQTISSGARTGQGQVIVTLL